MSYLSLKTLPLTDTVHI